MDFPRRSRRNDISVLLSLLLLAFRAQMVAGDDVPVIGLNDFWKTVCACLTVTPAPTTKRVDKSIDCGTCPYPGMPISYWDTSMITDMSNNTLDLLGFDGRFNEPGIGNWDTSRVTNMEGMFRGMRVFNQPLADWDTSNVRDMSDMFAGAQTFNQPLADWNVARVENFDNMFDGASAFDQPLVSWDITNTSHGNMFRDTKMDLLSMPVGYEASVASTQGSLASTRGAPMLLVLLPALVLPLLV